MKNYPWIFLSAGLLALAFAPGACGGGNTGAGGSGTTSVTTSSTSHTTGSGLTGTGGSVQGNAACDAPDTSPSNGSCITVPPPPPPPTCAHPTNLPDAGVDGGPLDCSGLVSNPDACTTCELSTCCGEITACQGNADCWSCLTDPNVDPATCQAAAVKALLDAFSTCANGCCTADCYTPPSAGCNPVTSAECTGTEEGCDTTDGTTFSCLPGATEALCAECDDAQGPWCAPGMHCIPSASGSTAGTCGHYCCGDGDCGTGKCDKTVLGSTDVGVCVKK